MSNNVEKYKQLDMMPTESLRTLLSLDIDAASGVELDADTVMHVMEVIQQREEAEGTAPQIDAEAAWKDFNEKYRPTDEESNGLQNTDALEIDAPKCVSTAKKKHVHLRRAIITVAAAVILVVGGTVSAKAAGIDLWRAIVEWASETFGFESNIEYADKVDDKQILPCKDLQELLDVDGIEEQLVPTWLPDGFEQQSCKSAVSPQMTKYCANYSIGEKELAIVINKYADEAGATHTFEKLQSEYSEYEVNGVAHYITCNSDGTTIVVWSIDDYECSIYGSVTETEMKQIIDSIYGE